MKPPFVSITKSLEAKMTINILWDTRFDVRVFDNSSDIEAYPDALNDPNSSSLDLRLDAIDEKEEIVIVFETKNTSY